MVNSKHASQDIRIVKCFDGLNIAFDLIHFAYENLYKECCKLKVDQNNLSSILLQCWSIIDNVHRIREISQAIPGLNKKNDKLLEFISNSTIAEEFRHYIQHLRSELLKTEIDSFPVWGALSWVDENENTVAHVAIIGSTLDGISYPSCVYDRLDKKWVSMVSLSVLNLSFNFDPIYSFVQNFKNFIIPWMVEMYEPGIELKTEIPIISAKIYVPSAEDEAMVDK